MVSNLPINAGDPVKAFFMRETWHNLRSKHFSRTYPWSFYEPVGLPVTGFYDDYGRIDDETDDASSRLVLAHYAGLGFKTESCQDVMTIIGGWDDETKEIRELWKGRGQIPSRVVRHRFAMVHAGIFDALVEIGGSDRDWCDKETFFDWTRKRIKKILKTWKGDTENSRNIMVYEIVSEFALRGNGASRAIADLWLDHPDEEPRILDYMSFVNGMGILRKHFTPTTGTGYQQNELKPYQRFQKAVNAHIKAELTRQKGYQ